MELYRKLKRRLTARGFFRRTKIKKIKENLFHLIFSFYVLIFTKNIIKIFFNFLNFRSPQNHFAMDIRLFTPLFTPF